MKKNILLTVMVFFSAFGIIFSQESSCFIIKDDIEKDSSLTDDVPAFTKIEDAMIIIYSKDSNYRFESNMSNFDKVKYDMQEEEFVIALPSTTNKQIITITRVDCPSLKQEKVINSLTPKQVVYYDLNTPEVTTGFHTGTFNLSTYPSSAIVEIEGMPEYQERTPLSLVKIRAESWPIHILKNGYKRLDTVISIVPGDLADYSFTLTRSSDPLYAQQEPITNTHETNEENPTESTQAENSETNKNQYSTGNSDQNGGGDYNHETQQLNYKPFYNQLANDGVWVHDPNYGYVWYPQANSEINFAPYSSNGYWTYTNYGWTWVSNYSWGAIPFHYGRWGQDSYGWYWVPDDQWGPAWVSWCSTNEGSSSYFGWAPLRPGLSANDNNIYWIPSERYVFVQQQYISNQNITSYYVTRENNSRYIHNSTAINEASYDNSMNPVYVHGPKRSVVEHVSGRPINMRVVQSEPSSSDENSNPNFVSISHPELTTIDGNSSDVAPSNISRRSALPVTYKSNAQAIRKSEFISSQNEIKTNNTTPLNTEQKGVNEQNNTNRTNEYQTKVNKAAEQNSNRESNNQNKIDQNNVNNNVSRNKKEHLSEEKRDYQKTISNNSPQKQNIIQKAIKSEKNNNTTQRSQSFKNITKQLKSSNSNSKPLLKSVTKALKVLPK